MFDWLRRWFRKEQKCSEISDEELLKRGSPLDEIPLTPAMSTGVPIKWCRAIRGTKTRNHMGRCSYDGKFCNLGKLTGIPCSRAR